MAKTQKKEAKSAMTDAEKGELASALRALELHLTFDPDHPASGVEGMFPRWMKTILRLQGEEVLEFLAGKAGVELPLTPPADEPV